MTIDPDDLNVYGNLTEKVESFRYLEAVIAIWPDRQCIVKYGCKENKL